MIQKNLSIILGLPFLLLTIYAVSQVGYVGIFDYHRHSPAGWQVFADLVVALLLLLTFMIPDAKERGMNPWPWVVATFLMGSLGPIAYFIFRREKSGGSA